MSQRQWIVRGKPLGRAIEPSDHELVEAPVREPEAGELLVRVEWLGIDPAQKSWIEQDVGYMAQAGADQVQPGYGAGTVLRSAHPDYAVGDRVMGLLGWRERATVAVSDVEKLPDGVAPELALACLGNTGRTAYLALTKVGRPKPGDTLLISAAAGATGSLAGQIGKLAGCRVVGIAGGPQKCAMLVEQLGFDDAIDYKAGNVRRRLKESCPDGIDIFFDNVGGELLDQALARLAKGARVVICGGIARYNADPRDPAQMPPGPRNYFNLVFAGATMGGFLIFDEQTDWPKADARLIPWLKEQRIKPLLDIAEGLENAPAALARLFAGGNVGKQLVRL
ncbi:NADP-dependent oxidoreductase [Rhizorhabdus dicambivorans]|uniref:NADP-dependent oxidoreductase n=1 Tax=Rhizorhabdus dicambivorans TaxID=1850238 RepID=A0A2A4FWX8_9SPHN|nr:NADP-dependent oxidoreductase [Rhizorhabdus dicambivorans]ATE63583.1 NADP-dependent oxidoreductase [Rhizorhabdus dicambivorans]PCE42708.1 NADP-dependent oxidoreductase [Rhizorhabdus dicambivorans]